ncbi:DUF6745 domain-containing protein [Oleisolibacter albus]|uniref:DUF6745 domain-containing protein n=1 Tax=Oleisolibacter albus TaxID=2171757 RepID=UPI000DF15CCA|nr:hypothetical protein [Oleisolibacter albus]
MVMEETGRPVEGPPPVWPDHTAWRDRLVWRTRSSRTAAEAAIRAAYEAADLPPPRAILWAGGPRDARTLLERTAWRRMGPWLLLVLGLLIAAMPLMETRPGLDGLRLELPHGALMVLGLAFLTVLIFAQLLSGALAGPGRLTPWLMIPVLVGLSCIGLGAVMQGDLSLPPLTALGGLLALTALILLTLPRPTRLHGTPLLFGRSAGPRLSRAFHRLLDRTRRTVHPAPYGLELGDRISAFVRLLAVVCPPSFDTPIAFYALDRLVRITLAPERTGDAERRLAAFADLAWRVDGLWSFTGVAIAMEPPVEVHLDERGRFHRADGPALRWRDGSALFAIDGRFASDPSILVAPDELTVFQIRHEPDPGLRRALIAQYGPERLMRTLGRRVSVDAVGELWRIDDFDGEPLVMVRVLNSTPEPDGSYKPYWLRVPPGTAGAHAGIAWTFGLTPGRYAPQIES